MRERFQCCGRTYFLQRGLFYVSVGYRRVRCDECRTCHKPLKQIVDEQGEKQ